MTARFAHSVDVDTYDLELAVALQLAVVADCGATFTPKALGSDVHRFPDCLACFPRAERNGSRGRHRHSTAARSSMPHYVYRCFDARGRLLYVGCTYNPPARMKQHRAEKREWITKVASTRLTVWPDRRKALDMERLAIETERPIHNKAFNRESA